jgi:hypothetical protein
MSFPHRDPSAIAKEFFESCAWQEAGDPGGAAYKASYHLFSELIERVSINRARWIFRHFARVPTKKRVNQIRNDVLLSQLDLMKPKPVILQLAKRLAKENEALPLEERKGPGGVDVPALAKHIENLVKKRERALAAGTWWGPITHEQAIRHFGAPNVATFSKK